jgi:GDP-L-fucose synthase
VNDKIVVLGGSGFVGRTTIDVFTGAQLPCTSASRSEGVDLRDPSAISEFLRRQQPAVIINCAAHVGSLNYVTEQAARVISDNLRMIVAMYEAVAANCADALIINPIANCAYPAALNTFVEDNWWDGPLHRSVLSFGTTRRSLWSVAECFRMQYGVRSVHFLVPNMYGPYDSTDPNKAHALNALTAKFVRGKANGQKEIVIWGSGIAVREWLYARDFARVVLDVIRDPSIVGLDEPLNIAQSFGLSVRELVNLISRAVGYEGDICYDHSMPDGAPRRVMDDRRFRKVFPRFEFTDLKVGITETISYYRSILPY